jgi:serine/threonine protein kinase
MAAPAGEQLGSYRLLSLIGAGGFGSVHLALDQQGRTVAVKVLHPHVAGDTVALARLAREVETMRKVRGPHIAEVLDASLTGERPYLVTRYIQGRPLSTMVAADGPVTGDALLRLARGLAAALAAIHGAGVIHRDLKPANVIVADGEPVVIDFGIAFALDSAAVTVSGAVLGTPGYLAPEVIEGRESGAENDVFSFAATLAYAATGRQPYGTGPPTAVAYRVVHQEADIEDTPPWLAPLLRECLTRDRDVRPTAVQLCARLGVVDLPVPPAPADATVVGEIPLVRDDDGLHGLATREVGRSRESVRRSSDEERLRQAARIRTRWVIGSGLVAALAAAAAQEALPEVSLLVLAVYACGVLADAAVGLFSRDGPQRPRVLVDVGSGVGAAALWLVLSATFSTLTLVLALSTVLFVLVVLVVAG